MHIYSHIKILLFFVSHYSIEQLSNLIFKDIEVAKYDFHIFSEKICLSKCK